MTQPFSTSFVAIKSVIPGGIVKDFAESIPTAGLPAAGLSEWDNSDASREARSTWARLIKKIFKADPLLCSCGARMRIVSFITDPRVVDRILRHRESKRSKAQDPFEPTAPPGVIADSPQ